MLVWKGRSGATCLCSVVSGALARKTQRLGLTQMPGAGTPEGAKAHWVWCSMLAFGWGLRLGMQNELRAGT